MASTLMALTYTPPADLGSNCPDFSLIGVDRKVHKLSDFKSAKALCVMFLCNHCPYVTAIEARIILLARELMKKGVHFVAICSSDSGDFPDDSVEQMRQRAKERNYPFVYLHDETQEMARKFDAVCTPDFFVYDDMLKLRYRGRFDDSWKDAKNVQHEELKTAILEIISGKTPTREQKASMGCSIKWKAK